MSHDSLTKFIKVLVNRNKYFPEETNDCAVIALSLATKKTYRQVYNKLNKLGRKKNRGTEDEFILDCLDYFGVESRIVSKTSFNHASTLRRINGNLPVDNRYLIRTYNHISYAEGGELLDLWHEESLMRVSEIRKLY